MSVLVNKDTKVLVQGLGKTGSFHTDKAIAYGTQMVGAVHPSKAGTVAVFEGETDHSGRAGASRHLPGRAARLPSVREAVAATGADASVIYVPPPFAADAIMEAAEAGIELIICITEGIPVADMVRAKRYLEGKDVRLVGPELPRGDHAPGVQDRHHARLHPHAGQDRRREPIRHAHLRGGVPAHQQRVWARRRPSASAATRSTGPTSSTA